MFSWKACSKKNFLLLALVVSLLGTPMLSRRAHAMDHDVRAVLVAGMYGIGAGTVLGIASYPFTSNVRGIFIGSSIGLYLGLVMGAYYISNRYDPENPLRPLDGRPLEDPYYHQDSRHETIESPPTAMVLTEGFAVHMPVVALRF